MSLKFNVFSYVIMENLKYMLSAYDPTKDPIYLGSRISDNRFEPPNYMSGGMVPFDSMMKY